MDIMVSSISLVCLSPILLFTAILVKLTSTGPVLFWSERVGFKGQIFLMPKFRSMTVQSKVLSREVATDSEIEFTPIGKFIRKFSLDELPQLWSVLIGDMSLIGPRPLLPNDYAGKERAENAIIYNVKPGITGLAQVKGRNFINPRRKIKYDVFYVKNHCLFMDIQILFKTALALFNTKLVK
jgi:O-antigen biosynthesis protein WbqP